MAWFNQKVNAKRVLEKQFIVNNDYKKLLYLLVKQDGKTHGGHNKDYKLLLCQLAEQDEKTQSVYNKKTFMLNIDN